jgi:hypothetical protein
MLLHQPLLPLKMTPIVKAVPITHRNSKPVAGPLVSKISLRDEASPRNNTIPMTYEYSCSHCGRVSARLKPNRRGV